jgi:uncharacterized RDD family membrane protein YckC
MKEIEQNIVEKTNQKWSGIEEELASIPRRAVAQFIDFTILGTIFVLATYQVKGVWLMMPGNHLWIIFDPICGVFLMAIFVYFIGMEWIFGFTIGKWFTGIQIVSEQGSKITMKQSVKRNLCRLVDGIAIYIIGIKIARESPLKQRYGDKVAKTVVVKHNR